MVFAELAGCTRNLQSLTGGRGKTMSMQASKISDSAKHIRELRINSCATLASAMIIASGRPHSVAEVVALCNDLRMAMRQPDTSKRYLEWQKTANTKAVH